MLSNWNILFWNYEFLSPNWLWCLFAVPVIFYFYIKFQLQKKGAYRYTGLSSDQGKFSSILVWALQFSIYASVILIPILIILALAQPFDWNQEKLKNKYKYGIDIIIALDVSESMLARDFEPNRLEASKKMAIEFVNERKGDRIGLVLYGSQAYTACPATVDYESLIRQIENVRPDPRLMSSTAIGIGLGTAVTRLREETNAGKVIILLTDGSNNSGDISPATAAMLAAKKNIKVYTIGIGSDETTMGPVHTPLGTHMGPVNHNIDELTLKKIARTTGGKYFRAKDNNGLKEIYAEIDKMEKRQIKDLVMQGNPPAHPESFINWALVLFIYLSISLSTIYRLSE